MTTRATTVVIDAGARSEDGAWPTLDAAAVCSLDYEVDLVVVVDDEVEAGAILGATAHDAERLRLVAATTDRIRTACEYARSFPGAGIVSAADPLRVADIAATSLSQIRGVDAPALASVVPTLRTRGSRNDPFALLLDVGATVEPRAKELAQFAILGATYARLVSDNDSPTVALLGTGGLAGRLPRAIRDADRRLTELDDLSLTYGGLVGADELASGSADVIVCGGLLGDTVLRTIEGVIVSSEELLEVARKRFQWRIGVRFLGGGIQQLRRLTNWQNYGGSPLLGYTHPVIVPQADSPVGAFVNAIRLIRKLVTRDLVGETEQAIARGRVHV